MLDRRRHAATARVRPHGPGRKPAAAPKLHRGGRGRTAIRDIYTSDHHESRQGGRFRWLISTCLAAAIGALAIIVVVYGSADPRESGDGILPALKRMSDAPPATTLEATLHKDEGLNWAVPKSAKLEVSAGTTSTRYMIHDTLKQRRGGRDYIYAKPYVRLMMRLATVPTNYSDVIPPFNPYKLYAVTSPIGSGDEQRRNEASADVNVKIVELLGGILPGEDGQELDANEVDDLVERSKESNAATQNGGAAEAPPPDDAASSPAAGSSPIADGFGAANIAAEAPRVPPNTTLIAKPASDTDDDTGDIDGLKSMQLTAGDGDTLSKMLTSAGAENWIAKSILEVARPIFKDGDMKPGFEVQINLAPSVTKNTQEPVRVSVFDAGHAHRLTVVRNAAGEFEASPDPVSESDVQRAAMAGGESPQQSSVYASLYAASLMQQIPSDTIQQIIRVHATETDFRRRVRPGDGVEMLFDLKDDSGLDGPPGDLLYTAITTGGETRRFYRFRAADGTTDFYDDNGNNSKKFLTRRPVRGDDVRLVSGYGMRLHPLLGSRRMHTGVDWASPTGTPILAAGTGVVEEAGYKGGYGNYVRIRHANGYQTAYGHISRYAPGLQPGVKVKQNQVIAYVGCTGLCQGPHVHFEILINNQFVDPLSIQVPNERQLSGADLAEYQKERARIEELKARAPVATSTK